MKQRKITAFRIMCLLIAVAVLVFLGSGYRIIILLLSIFSALVFGRLWCGYVCPLGFYQELLSMLRDVYKRQLLELSCSSVQTVSRPLIVVFDLRRLNHRRNP